MGKRLSRNYYLTFSPNQPINWTGEVGPIPDPPPLRRTGETATNPRRLQVRLTNKRLSYDAVLEAVAWHHITAFGWYEVSGLWYQSTLMLQSGSLVRDSCSL